MVSVPVGKEGVVAVAVALPGARVWVLKEAPLTSKATVLARLGFSTIYNTAGTA
jgi:hypothetical protein